MWLCMNLLAKFHSICYEKTMSDQHCQYRWYILFDGPKMKRRTDFENNTRLANECIRNAGLHEAAGRKGVNPDTGLPSAMKPRTR